MTREELHRLIDGRLIASCQARARHPLRDTATIRQMAQAAAAGGAAAIRCGGVGGTQDVAAVVAAVDLPVIGLTKHDTAAVYITPTVEAALAVLDAGADVVATDATTRDRPDGRSLRHTIDAVHSHGALVMADVATLAEGLNAVGVGADLVATTLSGYTPDSPPTGGPDLELVRALRAELPRALVVAEGRYHSPAAARAAVDAGATAVVVGTAITDPVWLTRSFVDAIAAGR